MLDPSIIYLLSLCAWLISEYETQRTCFPSSSVLSGPKSSLLNCPVCIVAAQLTPFSVSTGTWSSSQEGRTGEDQSCLVKENAALWRVLALCNVVSS